MDDQAIFNKARKISDPEVRDDYLRLACGDDSERLVRIKTLLNEDLGDPISEDPSLAEESIQERMETQVFRGDSSLLGKRIGPYKILQEIGEGGMGSVFMAEQEKPVRRRVALKIVKPGKADKQIVARFEAERQALAMMDHPNIAKVLDAGQTEDESPFLVMELVQGISITKYCDQNKLTPLERLKLFVPICKAIQHAHQKGILHRDLKPANVLVCIQDGKPVPKVIDFGLAKPLQHQVKLTDKTMFTEFGQVMGTVQYMSPEQAVLDALDVDTRSDIYSLGVMLYELLSGSTPVDQDTLKENALLEVLEIIREQDPPRPSIRLNSSKKQLATISEQRQIQPSKLEQILRNELDWVVMKALEKDRTRRYESANDFALDIERYLNGDAVIARPPTLLYRTSKYVRRHKGLLATVAAIAAALILVVVVINWQNAEAERLRIAELVGTTIDTLETNRGPAIAIILEELDSLSRNPALPPNQVANELKDRIENATGEQKRNLAYGLAQYGQVEFETILEGILDLEFDPDEIDNVVNALGHDRSNSVEKLKSMALDESESKNWNNKSRLAIIALYLGEKSLAAEMLRDGPENLQPKLKLPDLLSDFRNKANDISGRPEALRNTLRSLMDLSGAYYVLGEYDKALVELDRLYQKAANNPAKRPPKYLLLSALKADGPRALVLRAVCQAHAGLTEKAKATLEESQVERKYKHIVSYGQILVAAELGNMKAAKEKLAQMIAGSPKDGEVQYLAAQIAAQLAKLCRQKKLSDEKRFKDMTLKLLRTAFLELGHTPEIEKDPAFIPFHRDSDFRSLVAEISPPTIPFDPIQRTVFIRQFSAWSGPVASLAEIVADTDNKALRSGICSALGGFKKPGQEAKEKWRPVLNNWYANARDGGTHSSSGWALSQWDLQSPKITTSKTPPTDRAWWHEPNGLRFVKINAGNVTGENGPIKVQEDFWLSDSEVTIGLVDQFLADQEYHARFPELVPTRMGTPKSRKEKAAARAKSTFKAYDKNGDNILSWYETENHRTIPSGTDKNNDNQITMDEMVAGFVGRATSIISDNGYLESPNAPFASEYSRNWEGAVLFCNWLSDKLGLEACYDVTLSGRGIQSYLVKWNRSANGIRLPTKAEWEYACRCRTTTRFSFGNEESDLMNYGWFKLNSNARTHLIRGKICNAWGLFDMHGNVVEWCWDPIQDREKRSPNRGGHFESTAAACRSSSRNIHASFGFRVAQGPSSETFPAGK